MNDTELEIIAGKLYERFKSLHEQEQQHIQSTIYHNTRLLLRNYQKLKAHVQTVSAQVSEEQGTFWGHEYLNLNSIMQNKAKTVKMMDHVDRSLEAYKKYCRDNSKNGYTLIYQKYLGPKYSDEIIASEFGGVSRQAINRQINQAIDELSVILYGVDALKEDE